VQFVEALCFKPEGHGFEFQRRLFPIYITLPGDYSASNRNEYQKIFLGVKHDRCIRLRT
jgi:hypothetical protein